MEELIHKIIVIQYDSESKCVILFENNYCTLYNNTYILMLIFNLKYFSKYYFTIFRFSVLLIEQILPF